jgi:hypothetical protein
MTLSPLALSTTAKVFAALGLDDETDPTLVEDDIDAISALFEQATGRILASRVFTDVPQDGTGRPQLWLKAEGKWAYPVTTLTALTISSADFRYSQTVNVLPTANQMRFNSAMGRLTLFNLGGGVFPLGQENILGTFIAGYSLALHPAQRKALERAVILGIQWWQQMSADGVDVASIHVGDTSTTYHSPAASALGPVSVLGQFPLPIQAILLPFVARRI